MSLSLIVLLFAQGVDQDTEAFAKKARAALERTSHKFQSTPFSSTKTSFKAKTSENGEPKSEFEVSSFVKQDKGNDYVALQSECLVNTANIPVQSFGSAINDKIAFELVKNRTGKMVARKVIEAPGKIVGAKDGFGSKIERPSQYKIHDLSMTRLMLNQNFSFIDKDIFENFRDFTLTIKDGVLTLEGELQAENKGTTYPVATKIEFDKTFMFFPVKVHQKARLKDLECELVYTASLVVSPEGLPESVDRISHLTRRYASGNEEVAQDRETGKWSYEPIPYETFTMAGFGLGSLEEFVPKPVSYFWWYVLLAILGAGLVLWISLRRHLKPAF
jgi:hypothetical protein